jgi:1,4-alpha-glucan branching enzyme
MRFLLALGASLLGCGSSSKLHDDYRPPDFSDTTPVDAGVQPQGGDLATAPTMPGLGSTVTPNGVEFRVWAPDAQKVFVAGDWNSWSDSADELTGDGAGTFGGLVASAMPGQAYQYAIVGATATTHKPDPRAIQVDGSNHSVIVDKDGFSWTSTFTPPSAEEAVIYELHVGTFNVGAAVPSKFVDVEAKLDYLQSLGINMIELLPPAQFASKTSWGYNPSLPFAIAAPYGSADEFKHLVDAAHAHDIGVIIDVVHNHYSSRTPLWCYDGDCTGGGGVYFYGDARQKTPWGPRPDFSRDEVRNFVLDNALLWLGEFRCDGMRWDSVSNIRQANGADNPDGQSLLKTLNDTIDAQYPGSLQIAEDLQTIDSITKPTANGGYGFDSQWDAAFFHPVDDTLTTANDTDRKMSVIRDAITHAYNSVPTQRVVYTESHDEDANGRTRMPQMISPTDPTNWNARKRSTLGAAIVMTSPGIPMIFMGQEFLESGSFSDTNPLDWSKATTFAPILQLYTDLIHLRRNSNGTSAGLTGSHVDVFHVNEGAHVLAYRRWNSGGDDVIVLANFSSKTFTKYDLGLPSAGTWHIRLSSDDTKYSSDFTGMGTADVSAVATALDGLPYTGSFVLAGYSVIIASK